MIRWSLEQMSGYFNGPGKGKTGSSPSAWRSRLPRPITLAKYEPSRGLDPRGSELMSLGLCFSGA